MKTRGFRFLNPGFRNLRAIFDVQAIVLVTLQAPIRFRSDSFQKLLGIG